MVGNWLKCGVIATCLLLTAAAVSPAADGDVSTVYVLRPNAHLGSMLSAPLFVDGEQIAKLRVGEYVGLRLPPGQHRLQCHESKFPLDLVVTAGEVYYVEVTMSDRHPDTRRILWKAIGMLQLLDRNDEMLVVPDLRPVPAARISDRSMVTSDELVSTQSELAERLKTSEGRVVKSDGEKLTGNEKEQYLSTGAEMLSRAALESYRRGMYALKEAESLEAKLGSLKGKKLVRTEKKTAEAYLRAAGAFRDALGFHPKMFEAYVGLGLAYRATGMYKHSLEATAKGLQIDPANDTLFEGWAESVLALDQLDIAKRAHQELSETNPARAGLLMVAMKEWLAVRRTDPGELDPAAVEQMAEWVAAQEDLRR